MNYLYHFVPENLEGNMLIPLNELRDRKPGTFEKEAVDYVGRENITQKVIPRFNCFWNDVLHLSPIHPRYIKDASIAAGRADSFTWKFYEIDPRVLDTEKAVFFLNLHKNPEDIMNEDNFAFYHIEDIAKHTILSEDTKDFFKVKIKEGERPLLFHIIPHILYNGGIDVTNMPIIEV